MLNGTTRGHLPGTGNFRSALRRAFDRALAAVEPGAAVRAHLAADGAGIHLGGRSHPAQGRIVIVGAGKASAPLAAAVEDLLTASGRMVDPASVVVVKHGHGLPSDGSARRVRLIEAGHPVPDAAGLAGAEAIEAAITGLGPDDLVLCCLSGGASALLPAPLPPLTLADKQATTRILLASGADIHLVNAVRRRCSRLKGGGLARRAAPATVWTLALSDVPGDDPLVIGSGPTINDLGGWSHERLVQALAQLPGATELPAAVRAVLAQPSMEVVTGSAVTHYHLIGSNRDARDAATAALREDGLRPVMWQSPLTGEARDAADRFCAAAATLAPDEVLVAGGETTVTLGRDPGLGGRNQEFALAAALWIEANHLPLTVLAAGTDGSDGPTEAAGGWADAGTAGRARAADLDPQDHLARHDANPLLKATGDLLVTGPTRTNVMDLAFAVRG